MKVKCRIKSAKFPRTFGDYCSFGCQFVCSLDKIRFKMFNASLLVNIYPYNITFFS